MNKKYDRFILVNTPFDTVQVQLQILNNQDAEHLLENKKYSLFGEVNNFILARKVYCNSQENYLISYSAQFYIGVVSISAYNSITRNDNHDLISLIYSKAEDRFYTCFMVYSSGIEELLKKKHEILSGYERSLYHYDDKGEKITKIIAIKFEDGSILFYNERAPSVYDGSWCQDIESFKYLYNNKFI